MAIGDAYGSKFEGADQGFCERNNDLKYRVNLYNIQKHPEDMNPSLVRPAHYSDDTQMALAVVEAMLDDNEDWSVESLADRFVKVFKRDERRGYTTFFLNALMNSEDGRGLLTRIGRKSTKSGAFMRAAPLGVYKEFDLVVERARAQAVVTHDTKVGRASAVGAALLVHYFYHDLGPKENLVQWLQEKYFEKAIMVEEPVELEEEIIKCWSPDQGRRVRVHGWDCLHAAIYSILESKTLTGVLKKCVEYMGDVDTVATVAAAAASCSREIKNDLPRHLYDELENRKFGRDYLEGLDKELRKRFPAIDAGSR
jgi:ADP-ribosylglycohydrolase